MEIKKEENEYIGKDKQRLYILKKRCLCDLHILMNNRLDLKKSIRNCLFEITLIQEAEKYNLVKTIIK